MLKEIETHRDQIADLCRRYGVKRLELFGSAARGSDFEPGRSDIDFLVDFNEGQQPLFDEYFELQDELSELLGHRCRTGGAPPLLNSRNYFRRNSASRLGACIWLTPR